MQEKKGRLNKYQRRYIHCNAKGRFVVSTAYCPRDLVRLACQEFQLPQDVILNCLDPELDHSNQLRTTARPPVVVDI